MPLIFEINFKYGPWGVKTKLFFLHLKTQVIKPIIYRDDNIKMLKMVEETEKKKNAIIGGQVLRDNIRYYDRYLKIITIFKITIIIFCNDSHHI